MALQFIAGEDAKNALPRLHALGNKGEASTGEGLGEKKKTTSEAAT